MTSFRARLHPRHDGDTSSGGHRNVQVFAGADADHRAHTGDLVMRQQEAFDFIEHVNREAPAAAPAAPASWPLSHDDTDRVVSYLLGLGTREGLILGDLVNSKLGASARRRAERA